MKIFLSIITFLPQMLFAQLEIIPAKETPLVFGGKEYKVEVVFKNTADKPAAFDVRMRLYQASSGALLPLGEYKPQKQLQILAGQTVIENIGVDLPDVRAITEFRIRFSANEKQIADVKIQVAPDDLLKQLFALTGKTPIGVLDSDNQLKPLLMKNKVEFHDLENDAGFDGFQGKLAIIGPFHSKDSVPENLRKRIAGKQEAPFAIVWIQPSQSYDAKSNPLLPVYLVRENENTIVIVQDKAVAKLAELPKSQLNLLRAAQLALHPESLRLPENQIP